MRGVALTLRRLPRATAVIAGAAILAGASIHTARAASDSPNEEVAFAQPRLAPVGGGGVALPHPLPPSEAARIRRIFDLQSEGRMDEAAAATARLRDQLLLGAILADRYLRVPDKAAPAALRAWLKRYPDEADAPAIRALLLRRLPKGTKPPLPDAPAVGNRDRGPLALHRNPALDSTVHDWAQNGETAKALRLIARTKGMTRLYGATLRAEVARITFTHGRDAEALAIAAHAQHEAGRVVGLAGAVAGLAAWRLDRPKEALRYFEDAWHATASGPAERSAAAYWAARAHRRTGDQNGYQAWLRQAAAESGTFYGLIARRTLGLPLYDSVGHETLGEADIQAVGATPEGVRAYALLQVGQIGRAGDELRALWPLAEHNAALARSLMLVADKAGLSGLSAAFADLLQTTDGKPHDPTSLPIPKLSPRGGFRIDPALVYALARIESNFDAAAVSAAGARGLMQIMPITASYLAGNPKLARSFRNRLHDAAVNLEIGQRYVMYLAQHPAVDGNLILLLASYNAGPGNVAKWSGDAANTAHDPLLFIETIPFDETRRFVKRVLTYSWIYAAQLDLSTPSLAALAADQWPHFQAVDRDSVQAMEVSVRLH